MTTILLCVLIIVLNFIFLYNLSGFFVGKGSDHSFYDYYIQLIKENKNRFFSIFPNFVNTTPITDPQFFFRFVSYFSTTQKNAISLLLNPTVLSVLFSLVTYLIFPFDNFNSNPFFIVQLLLIIALTPQYFHGQNSRIYGLSARGVGLVFFFAFVLFLFFFETGSYPILYFFAAVFFGYLIWGISLFAQQAIVFFAILFLIVFNNYFFLAATISSLILFMVLHPAYARNFLISRWHYLVIYAVHMAKRFILNQRYSIWRDWVYDFWFKKEKKITTKFSYIYTNSLFIVIFLNPLVPISIYGYFFPIEISNEIQRNIFTYSLKLNLTGFIIFILTSFRITRFLGEPERYVEIIIPFSALSGLITLNAYFNHNFSIYLITAFLLINIVQLILFVFLRKTHPQDITLVKDSISKVIENSNFGNGPIRFFSNNQDWTKFFVNTKWNFIFFYPTVYEIGEVHITELIKSYPIFDSVEALKIVKYYDINYCLIDCNHFIDIEEIQTPERRVEKITTTDKYILYRISNTSIQENT
jgi:hypothetical protein